MGTLKAGMSRRTNFVVGVIVLVAVAVPAALALGFVASNW